MCSSLASLLFFEAGYILCVLLELRFVSDETLFRCSCAVQAHGLFQGANCSLASGFDSQRDLVLHGGYVLVARVHLLA